MAAGFERLAGEEPGLVGCRCGAPRRSAPPCAAVHPAAALPPSPAVTGRVVPARVFTPQRGARSKGKSLRIDGCVGLALISEVIPTPSCLTDLSDNGKKLRPLIAAFHLRGGALDAPPAGGRVELNRTLDLLDVPPAQPPFRGSAGAAVLSSAGLARASPCLTKQS